MFLDEMNSKVEQPNLAAQSHLLACHLAHSPRSPFFVTSARRVLSLFSYFSLITLLLIHHKDTWKHQNRLLTCMEQPPPQVPQTCPRVWQHPSMVAHSLAGHPRSASHSPDSNSSTSSSMTTTTTTTATPQTYRNTHLLTRKEYSFIQKKHNCTSSEQRHGISWAHSSSSR